MRCRRFLGVLLVAAAGIVHAEPVDVGAISAPDDFENIHVIPIASDPKSSDFVIFVERRVSRHKHVNHTESLYVLEGTGRFELGSEILEIGAGDFIKIPMGTPHAVTVTSETPMKAISVQAPEFFGDDRVLLE